MLYELYLNKTNYNKQGSWEIYTQARFMSQGRCEGSG